MSEAAAALGRRDADRWLAKAVIDVATEAAANRGAQAAARSAQDATAAEAADPNSLAPGRHRQNR
jgi:replication-associated recombination protein RarA